MKRLVVFAFACVVLATEAVAVPWVDNYSFQENDPYTVYPYRVRDGNPAIIGWTNSADGREGLNGVWVTGPGEEVAGVPYADNGYRPGGEVVAIIQYYEPTDAGSPNTLSQTISGFTVGRDYAISYYENAWANASVQDVSDAQVLLDGQAIVASHSVSPCGLTGPNPYPIVVSDAFTATAASHTVTFSTEMTTPGEHSAWLFDKVEVHPGYLLFGDWFETAGFSYEIDPSDNDLENRWYGIYGGTTDYTVSGDSNFAQVNQFLYPGSTLFLANQDSQPKTTVSPNQNFNDAGEAGAEFEAQIRIDPANPVIGTGSGAGLVVGTSSQTAGFDATDGVGFFIGAGGAWSAHEAGTVMSTGTLGPEQRDGFYDVRIKYDVDAFDGTSPVDVECWVDGEVVYAFTTAGGFSDNYVVIDARGESDGVDFTTHGLDELFIWSTELPDGPVLLEGDLNGDGIVSSADLDIVRGGWGQSVTPGDLGAGDPSGDGVVNSADLDIIRANWGRTASATAVPEPGTVALVLLGGLTLAIGSFRRRSRMAHARILVAALAVAVCSTSTFAFPVVENSDFEANDPFSIYPGRIGDGNGDIVGWTASNAIRTGLNGKWLVEDGDPVVMVPYADNGRRPDDGVVAVIQYHQPTEGGIPNTLTQSVSGFLPGSDYILTFYENARAASATVESASVTVGGMTVVQPHSVEAVGGSNAYHYVLSDVFTATAETMDLVFSNVAVTPGASNAYLFDLVRFKPAHTLFRDDFTAILPSYDVNPGSNDRPDRQTGAITGVTYSSTGSSVLTQLKHRQYLGGNDLFIAATDNVLFNSPRNVVSPDQNFEVAAGAEYEVEFGFASTLAADPNNAVGFTFGSSDQTAGFDETDGVGLALRADNTWELYQDGNLLDSGSLLEEPLEDPEDEPAVGGTVELKYSVAAFDGTTPVDLQVLYNGMSLSTLTVDGFTDNYLTVETYCAVDDAEVVAPGYNQAEQVVHHIEVLSTAIPATAVPEPTLLALIACAGLTMFGCRCRK